MPLLTLNNHFRPCAVCMEHLPFGVRSAGCYFARLPWRHYAGSHNHIQVYWGISGEGRFVVEDRPYPLRPGEVMVLWPGDYHWIEAVEEIWNYRWFTLDGVLASDTVRAFGLDREVRFAGTCPAELFEYLERGISDSTPEGQCRMSQAGYELLMLCSHTRLPPPEQSRKLCDRAKLMVEENFGDNNFNIELLARKLNIHRSVLSRKFKSQLGITPIAYLDMCRMQKMLSLLNETGLSVKEIASRSGFSDVNYAIKKIKKLTGKTPKKIRRA